MPLRPDIEKINRVYSEAVSDSRTDIKTSVEKRKKEYEAEEARKHSKLLKANVVFSKAIERIEKKLKVEESKLLTIDGNNLKRQQGIAVGIKMALAEMHGLIANTADPTTH